MGNLGNGYTVMDWMTSRLGLSHAETQVYACLLDASMGGTRHAIFSTKELSKATGLSPLTARKTISTLNELGFIRITQKAAKGVLWRALIEKGPMERRKG